MITRTIAAVVIMAAIISFTEFFPSCGRFCANNLLTQNETIASENTMSLLFILTGKLVFDGREIKSSGDLS